MKHLVIEALGRTIVATCFLVGTTAAAQTTLSGRVVDIANGDTVSVVDASNRLHRIRLAGIDAPERGQPGAHRSKDSLAALVYEQPVRVEVNTRDGDAGVVGKVWVAPPDSPCRGKPGCPMTLDAGLAQVTMGRAWWCSKCASGQSEEDWSRYESAEREARARKAGLWRDGKPVPPWLWRDRRLGTSASAAASPE